VAAAALVSVACAGLGVSADAQVPRQRAQPEARIDVIASRWTALQGALGVTVPTGIYVRSGVVAGIGGGGRGFDSRLDVFSRFSPDPFRQSRWAPYAGGGVSGRFARNDMPRARAYLLVFLGIEGPLARSATSGWVPAFELGLGGGVRVGFALRRGISGRR